MENTFRGVFKHPGGSPTLKSPTAPQKVLLEHPIFNSVYCYYTENSVLLFMVLTMYVAGVQEQSNNHAHLDLYNNKQVDTK